MLPIRDAPVLISRLSECALSVSAVDGFAVVVFCIIRPAIVLSVQCRKCKLC